MRNKEVKGVKNYPQIFKVHTYFYVRNVVNDVRTAYGDVLLQEKQKIIQSLWRQRTVENC